MVTPGIVDPATAGRKISVLMPSTIANNRADKSSNTGPIALADRGGSDGSRNAVDCIQNLMRCFDHESATKSVCQKDSWLPYPPLHITVLMPLWRELILFTEWSLLSVFLDVALMIYRDIKRGRSDAEIIADVKSLR